MTRTLTASEPDEPPRRRSRRTAQDCLDALVRARGDVPRGHALAHFYVGKDGAVHSYPGPPPEYVLRNRSLRALRGALDALIGEDPDPAVLDGVTAHVRAVRAHHFPLGDVDDAADEGEDDSERDARRAALSGDIADLYRTRWPR